jgi:peroxiredoxin Q/BCP
MTLARFALVALLALALPAAANDSPAVGKPAPDFKLQDQAGKWHTLEQYRGQWVVLYFYPKDDTPGCTTQACELRDNIFAFRKVGAQILGISVDDVA